MTPSFLEIILDSSDCRSVGIAGRDEIEDGLEDIIQDSKLGRVSGGGGGMGTYNIDVDVFDEKDIDAVIEIIRLHFKSIRVPESSRIHKHQPTEQVYEIYV